jgi:hypothetical protein
MQNFVFSNPTKIVFGQDAEISMADELELFGVKRVMIVYGQGSIRQNGLYDRVVRKIIKKGIAFVDFPGAKPNPILSHVKSGIELALKSDVDSVLAIGGGSSIDTAKAIAAGVRYSGDVWDFFEGKAIIQSSLPVFTILTIAAAGSEMNGNCVITKEDEKKKYSFSSIYSYPKVSALNPALTFSVSPKQSACGAIDAIAHLIEGYLTKQEDNILHDRMVEAIIKTIIKDTGNILENPTDYESRASFMWSASLALNGFVSQGLKEPSFPNHLIEHSLSALFDVTHGEGLAIIMPAWMRWANENGNEMVARFAKKIFKKKTPEDGIKAFEEWIESIGVATRLNEIGVKKSDFDAIADNVYAQAKVWRKMDKIYTKTVIKQILSLAFEK